jgi:DNA (cytosine-5)-methyltransferase 1
VNLFTDIGKDRSNFLVRWPGTPRGVRIFTPREQANLHGFPSSYQFLGSLGEQYDMVVDSVMPPMAYAIGRACIDYLLSITHLADVPQPLGYRAIPSRRQEEIEEAWQIIRDPEPPVPIDPQATYQLALW